MGARVVRVGDQQLEAVEQAVDRAGILRLPGVGEHRGAATGLGHRRLAGFNVVGAGRRSPRSRP